MSVLRELMEALGFAGAKTVLQSGNLVFDSGRLSGSALERRLEQETAERLRVSADYVVRTAAEWHKVIARNPFPREAKQDPGHLVVMFLKSAPAAKNVQALRAAIKGPEVIHDDKQQLYIFYPEGIGRSKLTGVLIEKVFGTRGTARNWNTILKLAALCK
jgi:uncharacterized protein (DUF1697 family)